MSIIPGPAPISMLAKSSLRQLARGQGLQSQWMSSASYQSCHRGARQYTAQRKVAVDSHSLACTWLTKSPGEVTPDDVLRSLPSLPSPIIGEQSIPVLLVTPHFAPWIDTTGSFLGQWMNRLYHDSQHPGPVDAIAAVIDKLPDTRPESAHASESEGMSLLFVRAENVQGKPASPRRIRGPEVEEPALVFSVQTGSSHVAGDAAHRPTHEVGLRLANTVFVNGNENTMFGMRWTRDDASDNFVLDRFANLSTCAITSTAETVWNSFELPLHPVGQRRMVVSSMGNILRQVTGATDDDSIPASSELEKELPRYIEEHDIADPLVAVWALIEKPEVGSSIEADRPQDHVAKSLRGGGKLYRVMSGGGGWGKKQGLLSLDPDATLSEAANQEGLMVLSRLFGDSAPMQDLPPSFDKGLVIDDLNLLSQAASRGDYIQFFVSVEPSVSQGFRSELLPQQTTDLSYCFGVVFDPEDDAGAATGGMRQKDLAVLPNYFGALSSKTITYLQPVQAGTGEALESSTKLDVPGSRVGLVLE